MIRGEQRMTEKQDSTKQKKKLSAPIVFLENKIRGKKAEQKKEIIH